MCIDFRALENISVKNKYPLPIIDNLLDQLKNDVYFTNLDLKSGYHQIKIVNNDVLKTTSKTKKELFKWLLMQFGL